MVFDLPELSNLTAKVEEKLGLITYDIDNISHIEVKDLEVCKKCKAKWCTHLCPAKVYEPKDDGTITFNYENCIECGAAPYICPYGNIKWIPPRGGKGIIYKYG